MKLVRSQRRGCRSRKPHLARTVLLSSCIFLVMHLYSLYSEKGAPVAGPGRQLLGSEEPEIYQEYNGMCDSWLDVENRSIAITMYLFGTLYMFWGLAVVCDDFFVA